MAEVEETLVESVPAQGHFVRFVRDEDEELPYDHTFCGPNRIPGAQCPNCKKPLLRFLSLDARDPRLEFGPNSPRMVPLLYCWRCNISQCTFGYKIWDDGSVGLMSYREGIVSDDFPYSRYPDYFPGVRVTLEAISDLDQKVIRLLNRNEIKLVGVWKRFEQLEEPTHQVGGEPCLVQPHEHLICPSCCGPMPFLASIGDDSGDGAGFTKNSYVQVTYQYCRACRTMACYQRCD